MPAILCFAAHSEPMPININRILNPVELSVAREGGALRYAIALAGSFRAQLVLCFSGSKLPTKTIKSATEREMDELIRRALEIYLAVPSASQVDWESIVIEAEDVAQGIVQEAARRGVSLIVMSASRHPVLHALLGSVAESVCRTAPCPVLVTHPSEHEWVGATTGEIDLRVVLVAHDFSDYSELALQHGLAMAQKFQSELHLLHVISEPVLQESEPAGSKAAIENIYHQTTQRLNTAISAQARLGCQVKTVVRWGKPYREVLSYVKEHAIDLIAMGAHGAGFEINALFGSNVDRVLRQVNCPVLIARHLKPELENRA